MVICSRRIVIAVCIALATAFFPVFLHAEVKKPDSKPWLGLFIGSEIPGYKVMKSNLVTSRAWQSINRMLTLNADSELSENLVSECKSSAGGGVAVINIRSIVALGTVPGPASSPSTNITNGMFREYEGDCVTEVTPLVK
jgi:hypothetical protein